MDGTLVCRPVRLVESETHKVWLKFDVPDGTVHGIVYIFKKSSSRGVLIFHESARGMLAATCDYECVCARLRVTRDQGTIGISRTVYSYIFAHQYEREERDIDVMKNVTNVPPADAGASMFDKYVSILEKIEQNPVKLAQDIAYLSAFLRFPDDIYRRYQRRLVDKIQHDGGDIQGVIDVYERASRISTLLSMFG